MCFLRNAEPNLAQPDDAQAVAVRIEGVGCNVLLCVGESCWIAATGCRVGPGEGAESREDQPNRGVGYGFSASCACVAIDDAFLGQRLRVDPVESSAG